MFNLNLTTLRSIFDSFKRSFYVQRRIVIITAIALILQIPITYLIALKINLAQSKPKDERVLGTVTTSQEPTPSPSPSPTQTPSPSPFIRRPTPTPVPAPSPTPSPSPTPANSPSPSSSSSTTESSPTPTPSPSSSPSPTPSPQASTIEVKVDYAGYVDRSADTYSATFSPNQTAWTVVSTAISIENLQYTDYGGDLGIFITGINGVVPAGNNFWLFRVNGADASLGVSSYVVAENDKIEFVISSF